MRVQPQLLLGLLIFGTGCPEKRPVPLVPVGDAGVTKPDAGTRDAEPRDADDFDPLCESCRSDGESCDITYNCEPGSICNTSDEGYYDSSQPDHVCIRIVCSTNADCIPPKVCTAQKICEPPVCQTDVECPGLAVCTAGACVPVPAAAKAASCIVLTRTPPLFTGKTVRLRALILDANGESLPGLALDWTSSDTMIAAVNGEAVRGGGNAGTALITAVVRANRTVTCSQGIANLIPIASGGARVVVVAEDDFHAIAGADVTLFSAAQQYDAQTDGNGIVELPMVGALVSITVRKDGFDAVSVLQPASDALILLPPKLDPSIRSGFRGVADLSKAPRNDVYMGVAGFARRNNVLDYTIAPQPMEIIPTVINAPELSLNNEQVDLPGNYLLGLGNKRFTDDPLHCDDAMPGADELGCYLVRTPPGRTSPYVFAGALRLSQVTPIATQLSQLLSGEPMLSGESSYRFLLSTMSPLVPFMHHGAAPVLQVANGIERADLKAEHELNVLSRVRAGQMPRKPDGTCPEATLVTIFSMAEGRGLLPLGVRSAPDVEGNEAPNCLVAPIPHPFGDNSPDTEEGEVPIAATAKYAGLEEDPLLIAASAFDNVVDTNPAELSTVYQHAMRLEEEVQIAELFLAYPRGVLHAESARFELLDPMSVSTATYLRIVVSSGSDRWIIYAAPSATTELPQVAALLPIAGAVDATANAQVFRVNEPFGELFWMSAGVRFDRLADTIRAVSAENATIVPD